jgi:hypothetical protein
MSKPQFPEFKPIDLKDRAVIESCILRHPSPVCELNFGNLFLWRSFERSKFTFIHGNLCILCAPPSEPAYFLPPIGGERIEETLEACFSFAPRISRAPEGLASSFGRRFRCEPDRDNFDYVYRAEDLIYLKGKKYDGKRNRIRKFERSRCYNYLSLSSEHLEGCRRLVDEWIRAKALTNGFITHVWRQVIEEAFLHFASLGLVGGVIEVEGRIAAFSIGERFSADTAVIHIEVAHPEFDGLSQLMNREFSKNAWSDCRFINREQDNGNPGLRRAKTSYHPHHMVKKFNIWAEAGCWRPQP